MIGLWSASCRFLQHAVEALPPHVYIHRSITHNIRNIRCERIGLLHSRSLDSWSEIISRAISLVCVVSEAHSVSWHLSLEDFSPSVCAVTVHGSNSIFPTATTSPCIPNPIKVANTEYITITGITYIKIVSHRTFSVQCHSVTWLHSIAPAYTPSVHFSWRNELG